VAVAETDWGFRTTQHEHCYAAQRVFRAIFHAISRIYFFQFEKKREIYNCESSTYALTQLHFTHFFAQFTQKVREKVRELHLSPVYTHPFLSPTGREYSLFVSSIHAPSIFQ
jgi:hypothetical protein